MTTDAIVEALAQVAKLDEGEIDVATAMAAARLAYMHGYQDAIEKLKPQPEAVV